MNTTIKKNSNFLHPDELLDGLYKYTRAAFTLNDLNTKENTEIYKNLNSPKKCLTYIWNHCDSLDDL